MPGFSLRPTRQHIPPSCTSYWIHIFAQLKSGNPANALRVCVCTHQTHNMQLTKWKSSYIHTHTPTRWKTDASVHAEREWFIHLYEQSWTGYHGISHHRNRVRRSVTQARAPLAGCCCTTTFAHSLHASRLGPASVAGTWRPPSPKPSDYMRNCTGDGRRPTGAAIRIVSSAPILIKCAADIQTGATSSGRRRRRRAGGRSAKIN